MKKIYDYNPEDIYEKEVFGEETIEETLERLRRSSKYSIVCKTIMSGEMIECQIYQCFSKKDTPRRDKTKLSTEAQQNLNDKNAKKKIVRIIHTNFAFHKDLILDPSYDDKHLPTEEQAKKDISNYIRKIKRVRKKLGLPELKYIYVIGTTKSKGIIRYHFHMIINDMNRDLVESLWGKGRVTTRRLQPDDFGVEGRAIYMAKHSQKQKEIKKEINMDNHSKWSKRWYGSRNLKQPKEYRSITKLSKKKMEQMARKEIDWKETFERLYKGRYIYADCQRYISDQFGGVYLYCRMRRRD